MRSNARSRFFIPAAGAADANEAKVEAGVDQAGDFVDSKTGGQYAGQVDQAQEFLKDQLGGTAR